MPMRVAMLAVLGGCLAPPFVTPSKCGDGVVDSNTDEKCDDSGPSAACDIDCTLAMCGDGHVNAAAGEECDHGHSASGDGCSADCRIERCDSGESCFASYCGNGVIDEAAGEVCDPGHGETGDCDLDCTAVACGDGYVNITAGEECEGGPSFFCDDDCTGAWCGDGSVNAVRGETCDDGNDVAGDGCSAGCRLESCGNGVPEPGEQCDSGGINVTSCDLDCTVPICGDDVFNHLALNTGTAADLDDLEACDEGGVDTETCNLDCTMPACGDGHVNVVAGEECDDGNVDDSDWCLTSCESASCEDGIRNGNEEDVDCGGHCDACGATRAMVVAGWEHTCALQETGAVRCWGQGGAGQLGYGNTNTIGDNETPASAGDVNVGGPVVQLAAGGEHTCALLETGAVRCWGYGGDGQLGYGNTNTIGDNETPASAGDVNVGGPVVQLAAGYSHTCALLETGAVRCWGDGGGGPLGYGNTINIGDNEAPATAGDVNVGGPVVQLAAGSPHTCALLETGAVRCWGEGDEGQLGYGNTNNIGDNETPASAGDVDLGEGGHGDEVQLVAGWQHTCVLRETGAMRCWGMGWHGRLGYGNTNDIGDDEVAATAGDVNVGGRVVQPVAGVYHTCALLETGAVRCWGNGGNGRLGYGVLTMIGDNETPESAGNVNVGADVVQLAASHHTCALLETGAVRCWGEGDEGQLGYGNMNDIGDDEVPAVAGDVNVGGPVVQLVAGGYHTCALLETGAVRCWGRGAEGQLGYGNTNNIGDDEVPATAGDVNVGGPVMQLAAGTVHTCALLVTGAVRCWGNGGHGRLGYGNINPMGDDEVPATVGDVNVGRRVVQLAAGGAFICALLETGAVRCWGSGWYGQLGYGNRSNIGDDEVPAMAGDVNVGGSVVQLAAGGMHVCALLETGAVRCWGWGLYGRLGYGNTNDIGDDETPASVSDVPYR